MKKNKLSPLLQTSRPIPCAGDDHEMMKMTKKEVMDITLTDLLLAQHFVAHLTDKLVPLATRHALNKELRLRAAAREICLQLRRLQNQS
jgi:hypothetical protein